MVGISIRLLDVVMGRIMGGHFIVHMDIGPCRGTEQACRRETRPFELPMRRSSQAQAKAQVILHPGKCVMMGHGSAAMRQGQDGKASLISVESCKVCKATGSVVGDRSVGAFCIRGVGGGQCAVWNHWVLGIAVQCSAVLCLAHHHLVWAFAGGLGWLLAPPSYSWLLAMGRVWAGWPPWPRPWRVRGASSRLLVVVVSENLLRPRGGEW